MRRPIASRYRLSVLSRLIAALAGGYGAAALLAVAGTWVLAQVLLLSREEASTIATLAALIAMPVSVMGCFWARSAMRAWIGIAGFAALFGAIALAAGWRP